MKKLMYFVLLGSMIIVLTACNGNSDKSTSQTQPTAEEKDEANPITSITSIDKLEDYAANDVKNTIETMEKDRDNLSKEINSYEKYVSNKDKIEAFYKKTIDETNALGIRLRECSLRYAKLIVDSNKKYEDKYDELKGIYKYIYEDAGKDMYDIYDDVLKEVYRIFYDGILKDAYNTVEYDDWSDTRSDEYDLWSDTRSDVYDIWSDARSDIYDFYSDVTSNIYSEDDERVQKNINDFKNDIDKLKKEK